MILILDDHPLACQGLSSLIQMYKPDEEILQARTIRDSISAMEANDPEYVFIDLNLGKESGFTFLKWIRENNFEVKVFIITSSSSRSDFETAQELGVDAYVLKDAFIDEIMYGFKTIERGGKFYSATLVEQLGKVSEEEKAIKSLTDRELEVFSLLKQGYSNAKISEALFISEGTTKKHISNILGKLQINNRVEAVLFANKNDHSLKQADKYEKSSL